MPNRYIKESCVTSLTLTPLSDGAERFFWRLTVVADDYGRFDANPMVLGGRCVPTLNWSRKKVENCLVELNTIAPGDTEPLVELYQVRGRTYGYLTNWKGHQRDRSKEQNPPKPKFPDPTDGSRCTPRSAANRGKPPQLAALTESESVNETEDEDRNRNRATPHPAATQSDWFEAFWNAYPRKKGKQKALEAWLKLSPDEGLRQVILAAIVTQQTWPQWTKDNGQFIPHPATWLNQKRWQDEEAKLEAADWRKDFLAADDAEPEQVQA